MGVLHSGMCQIYIYAHTYREQKRMQISDQNIRIKIRGNIAFKNRHATWMKTYVNQDTIRYVLLCLVNP